MLANLMFYLPLLVLALLLERWASSRAGDGPVGRRAVVIVTIAATLFYAAIGWYVTAAIGEHSGDEGHYLTQALSLYADGDLDIRNNLEREPDDPAQVHISPNARDGHWYSWHPFGLSLLLAPLWGGGVPVRHLVLGAFAGAGLGGLMLLCRRCGAGRAGTWLAVLLYGASLLWGVYSARALPEVPGATVLILMVVAVAYRDAYPRGTLVIVALCAGALPWLHPRFAPLSVMGACAYGLGLWRRGASQKRPYSGLALFGALLGTAALVYAIVQHRMFTGGSSYPTEGVIWVNPAGMWQAVASDRGVLAVLPMFAWMLAAALWASCRTRDTVQHVSVFALAVLAAVLVTSCSTPWWFGGACLPGRYLLVATPLLVIPTALVFDRAGRVARGWLIVLGLWSVGLFVLLLTQLDAIGKAFTTPAASLAQVAPVWRELLDPWLDVNASPLQPWALVFLVATGTLPWLPAKGRAATAIAVALILLSAGALIAGDELRRGLEALAGGAR